MGRVHIGLYEKSMPNHLTLEDKLRLAKDAGFDYLEISVDETDEKLARLDWSGEQKFSLLEAIYRVGIPIRTMCLSGHRKYPLGSEDEAARERGLEIMSKAIDFAAAVGIRIIQIAGYDVYYEQSNESTRSHFDKNLKICTRLAASQGVMLGFETMETEFMNTVQKAMAHVQRVQSPYLQVYPDVGNLTNASLLYGTDVVEDLRLAKGHLCAVHLKESLPNIYREVIFGQGHVDFKRIIETSLEMGVKLFTLEFWHTAQEDWQAQITGSKCFFEKFFK